VGEVRLELAGCWPIDTTYYAEIPEELDNRFLLYQLRHLDLRRLDSSTATPSLRRQDLEAQVLVIPAMAEQRRIVEVVEDHFSRLDASDRYLAAVRGRTETLAEAALRQLLSRVDAPDEPLGDLLSAPLNNGRSVPSRENGFPVLRLTALKNGGVDLSERKGGDWTRGDAERFLVSRGDYLVARGNGTLRLVGRGALVREEPDPVAYPDTAIRIRPDTSRLSSEYLDVVWNSASTRTQIEGMARTTAGIYKVNQRHVASVRLPVPSLDEQQRVVSSMFPIDVQVRRLTEATQTAASKAGVLRHQVLSAAFSGKLTGHHTDAQVFEDMAK
jgi:type I restriction enzyme S subunit